MKLLGKLGGKTSSFNPRFDGDPLDGISAEDLAYGLAGITNESGPSLLLWAKYGQDVRSCRKLLARIKGSIVTQWGEIDLHVLQAFGETLLHDLLLPHVCLACNGEKTREIDHKHVPCNRCFDPVLKVATGITRRSDLAMAQALQISREDWRYKYQKRYKTMMDILWDWEYDGIMAIKRRILWRD